MSTRYKIVEKDLERLNTAFADVIDRARDKAAWQAFVRQAAELS